MAPGPSNGCKTLALSGERARILTTDCWSWLVFGHPAHVVGDERIAVSRRSPRRCPEGFEQRDAPVIVTFERRSIRLVRRSGGGARQDRAMATITRCRMPPES